MVIKLGLSMSSVRGYFRRFALAFLTIGFVACCSQCEEIELADSTFIDELHGWVSVLEPTPAIYKTSDGGKKWLRVPIQDGRGFYRLRFFDLNTGLAIRLEADGKTGVYRTTDSGQTWVDATMWLSSARSGQTANLQVKDYRWSFLVIFSFGSDVVGWHFTCFA
jgi:photosystem II stability/assembly factor-like uncharacterized protein